MDFMYRRVWFRFSACLLFLTTSSFALADFPADVAYAPDTNLNLTVSAIKSARQSILLNIYEFTSSEIADALLSQIKAGVHVEVLAEGQTVGGLAAAAKGIESQIAQAMRAAANGDHLYLMTSKGSAKRRYRFDHAKYAVIDGDQLLLGSENYSPTGNPLPGTLGNRGWEVLLHDAGIAQNYQSVFAQDADPTKGDVLDITSTGLMLARYEPSEVWSESMNVSYPGSAGNGRGASGRMSSPITGTYFSVVSVSRITSPDSSLSGLTGLINNARTSIDIELMTFDSAWAGGATNPLIAALEQAARRGVRVRVLLNDEAAFAHAGSTSKPKNQPTADMLNSAGGNMSAKIANIKGMGVDYIHNKGMLVDGNMTLISSINWDSNSILNNREAAVAINSSGVNSYYESIFEKDWQVSGGR